MVAITPELQAFATRDVGFQQFCDRYETVSADPETRREYAMWFDEALREEGMLDWARQEGRDEVRDEYEPRLAEAEQKLLDVARSMKNQGISIEAIKTAFPSLVSEIEEL